MFQRGGGAWRGGGGFPAPPTPTLDLLRPGWRVALRRQGKDLPLFPQVEVASVHLVHKP